MNYIQRIAIRNIFHCKIIVLFIMKVYLWKFINSLIMAIFSDSENPPIEEQML